MSKEKNWTGNSKSVHSTLGASNHSESEREFNDYYATPPKATKMLLGLEDISKNVWEPACGEGHISEVLKEHGYNVYSTDVVERGYEDQVVDFLDTKQVYVNDIITNPPYKYALEFAQKGVETLAHGRKLIMFMKLQFLESQKRKDFLKRSPLKTVWVSSSRMNCAKGGNFDGSSSAVAYCWFVWEKGYEGDPIIKWFN